MGRYLLISLQLLLAAVAFAQDASPEYMEPMLENATESLQQEPEQDQLQQDMQYLIEKPFSINLVTEEELASMNLIDARQIITFMQYRDLFGPIRSRYELQAIPLWDIGTIRKMIPYLRFSEDVFPGHSPAKLAAAGRHQVIVRAASVLEPAKGFQKDSAGQTQYAGSGLRLLYRYSFQFRQQLWWGLQTEKDAGEKAGDFYSAHLFIRRNDWLKTIALGDYILNIGQGLVHWQGLSFGKTSEVMNVFRQGPVLQPYRSSGEWNFLRGAALQCQWNKFQLTLLASRRKISGNLLYENGRKTGFSSFSETGYHRTKTEREDRNGIGYSTEGAVWQFVSRELRVGISVIQHRFSIPYRPEQRPDNKYAIRGNYWYNSGMHYSYTVAGVFLFGEAAFCKGGSAFIQGLVKSLHHKVDLALVYRHIEPGYQALQAGSFTEGARVTNESGWYSGIRMQPWPGWQVQAYADYFRFPWLRYSANAPGAGHEYLIMVSWKKAKKWDAYLRYRVNEHPENSGEGLVNYPLPRNLNSFRLQVKRTWNTNRIFTGRVDYLWYSKNKQKQSGFGVYLDLRQHLPKYGSELAARLNYFHTDGYNTRIYGYERDLLYSFSIPSLYDQGLRYYCQLKGRPWELDKKRGLKLQWWLRWAQTVFGEGHVIGSGTDEIEGSWRSEWKCQLMLSW